MSEWIEINCQERDDLYWNGFAALPKPIASSTDPERYIYTEWGHPDTDEPVLRDHRWPDGSRPCKHEVPAITRRDS